MLECPRWRLQLQQRRAELAGTAVALQPGMRLLWMASTLAAFTACTTNDAPTLSIDLYDPGTVPGQPPPGPNVAIALSRPYGHTFAAPVTATINGVAAGAASLSPGHAGSLRDPEVPASASFHVPLAAIERGVTVEVIEGSEHFVMEVSDFNASRAITVHSPLDGLQADGWIDLASGVATDQLAGGFDAAVDGGFCFTQWDQKVAAGTLSLRLPPAGTFDGCAPVGVTNAPGSTRSVQLTFDLWSTTPVTRCDGPGLTCAPVTAPPLTRTMPATLQF